MSRNPINREKALELYAKHSSLRREIADWHFNQRLDALGAR
jgi:hypothetical protein